MFIKTTNGQIEQFPYTLDQLGRDHPNVSFPENISNDVLASYGVYPVELAPAPTYDARTQRLEQGEPAHVDGAWVLGWSAVEKSEEEVAQTIEQQKNLVRSERNAKLSECDWTQLQDAPVNQQAWANYRQALRDVTAQAGFPWDIAWPEKPQ